MAAKYTILAQRDFSQRQSYFYRTDIKVYYWVYGSTLPGFYMMRVQAKIFIFHFVRLKKTGGWEV